MSWFKKETLKPEFQAQTLHYQDQHHHNGLEKWIDRERFLKSLVTIPNGDSLYYITLEGVCSICAVVYRIRVPMHLRPEYFYEVFEDLLKENQLLKTAIEEIEKPSKKEK